MCLCGPGVGVNESECGAQQEIELVAGGGESEGLL